jgi:hypothetical protein
MSTPPYCAASRTTMIGKPTAARNLDQRRGSVLRREERARSVTQRSPRLSMPLHRALLDIKLGIAEILIKKVNLPTAVG